MATVFNWDDPTAALSESEVVLQLKTPSPSGESAMLITDTRMHGPAFRSLFPPIQPNDRGVVVLEDSSPNAAEAWSILLDWSKDRNWRIVIGRHPTCINVRTMISCWLLGHRYDIKDFQDGAMQFILLYAEQASTLQHYNDAFNFSEVRERSGSGSKLSQLAVEELAKVAHITGSRREQEAILTRLSQGSRDLLKKVYDEHVSGSKSLVGRMALGQEVPRRREFLVGRGRTLPLGAEEMMEMSMGDGELEGNATKNRGEGRAGDTASNAVVVTDEEDDETLDLHE